MPMYVYACGSCGIEVQERRKMSQIDDPLACPLCSQNCSRAITAFSIGSGFKEAAPASDKPKRAHRVGCPCCVPRAPKKATLKTL